MTKKLKIGDAVYLDRTSIRISKQDDWGWFYQDQDNYSLWVTIRVRKKLLGGWKSEIIGHNEGVTIDSITIDEVDEKNGLPYSFSATIKIGNRTIHAAFNQRHRVSVNYWNILNTMDDVAYKKEKALLVEDSGYYPTKFFFTLGAVCSGQTCWLYALQTKSIRDRIVRNSDIRYFGSEQPEQTPQLRPTCVGSMRFQKYYWVNKEGEKVKVKEVVFVVGLAGEINSLERQDNCIDMIWQSIKKYASGIFFVRNDKWLFGDVMNQYDPAGFVYHHLMEGSDALTEKDICYILTCADRIKKIIEDDPEKGEQLNLTPDSPIFKQVCTPEQMTENKAITSDIMRRISLLIGNSPCFAVSSCSEVENEKGETLLDFSQGYNAELPLIYMLTKD